MKNALFLLAFTLTTNGFTQTPDWTWAKSAGGISNDMSSSVSTDADGNVLVMGYFLSPTIPFGTTTLTNADNTGNSSDIFIASIPSNPPPPFPKSTWTQLNSNTNIILRSVYFTDPQHGIAVGDFGTIVKTADAGHHWKTITGPTDHLLSVNFIKPSTGWACAVNGKVYQTTDSGSTWNSIITGVPNSLFSIQFINDQMGFAVGENGMILKTIDGGTNWAIKPSGTTEWLFSVYFVNENVGWAVGDQQTILKTMDAGETWTTQHFSASSLGVSASFFLNEYMGWAVGYNGTILKTTNGGGTWSDISYAANNNFSAVQFVDSLKGWIAGSSSATNGLILHTIDGGVSWNPDEIPGKIKDLRSLFFLNGDEGFAVGENGNILKTLKGLQNETVTAPVVGDTLHLDTAGMSMVFNNLYSSQPLDSVSLTVNYLPEEIPVTVYNDSVATIFNNSFWQAIAVNIDSFSAEICFYFNPDGFNTNYLQYLSCVYQEATGEPWSLINSVPVIDSNKICFTTDHFSNWALAITKADARVKKDTILFNATGQAMQITKTAPDAALTMKFSLQPGETDSVTLRRYDINPGGDFPAGINKFTETFWEVKRSLIDSTDIWIDLVDVNGYTVADSGKYRVLYRPDALTDWAETPTYRVRRGMKEVLITKSGSARGHFIVGVGNDIMPLFAVNVTTDSVCAGDTIHFLSSITGGTAPYQYSWSGEDGLSGTGTELSHVYPAIGTYNYDLSVKDSAGVETVYNGTVNMDCVTGMDETLNPLFFIAPNPVNGHPLKIVFKNKNATDLTIMLYDIYGRKIYQKTNSATEGENRYEVSMGGVAPGLYLLKIEAEGKMYLQRVVVR